MAMGMNFGTTVPSNYQNGMYWQYLMQSMQQAQQMQQQKYNDTLAMMNLQKGQQALQNGTLPPQTAVSSVQNPVDTVSAGAQTSAYANVGDGKDDGKISFGKKCKNLGKGALNFFKGMVCDDKGKFSLTRTLTTVGVAAGAVALTVATGGAATPFLIAGAATLAAVQTGKGIYNAATATTDAQAEAAWQEIGSGTTALVGSVAGAKGALRAAGAPIPKGNMLTSSLKATWDCIKLAKNGVFDGGKAAIMHPMQSTRAVRAYYANTVKPNMAKAFSYKNGHQNYTSAMEQKYRNNIKNIDTEIKALKKELAGKPDAARVDEITIKLNELDQQKIIQNARLDVNNAKNKQLAGLEKSISDIEAKLADSSVSTAEKARLTAQREQLYKAVDSIDRKFEINFNKKIATKENYIESLKQNLETAPEAQKASIQADIKLNEGILKGWKHHQKVEIAQHRVLRAEADIVRLKDNLRTATTDAQKESIAARIAKVEKAVAADKKILKNANYEVAAKAHLPKVGLAYGTYYLANPAAQVDGLDGAAGALSEADAYAQSQGFESAAAMQQYINAMQSSQQTLNNANQLLGANNTYGYNTNSIYSLPGQAPVGTGLDFNDLYVSPYPTMY